MCFKAISLLILVLALGLVNCQDDDWDKCGRNVSQPTGFDNQTDINFFRKLARTLNLFKRPQMQMSFFLYKQAFPACGQELKMDDDSLQKSGFNVSHPTRIVIHGWMSESKSPFGRDVKDAYLSIGDFNVIIIDWSVASGTLNYYRVVNLIDDFGEIVANFTKHLHNTLGVSFDDMYLIGHSLGAQIAGSAGRQIAPQQFNTIFALDPAGPAFRGKPLECRIDPTDAKYVESIQTSVHLGLAQPVGHGSFFPNKGVFQKCLTFGCSHTRAYKFFAESLTSKAGFWGIKCDSIKRKWHCHAEDASEYRMGGEPSLPKAGTFYVKTRGSSPYAMGRVNIL